MLPHVAHRKIAFSKPIMATATTFQLLRHANHMHRPQILCPNCVGVVDGSRSWGSLSLASAPRCPSSTLFSIYDTAVVFQYWYYTFPLCSRRPSYFGFVCYSFQSTTFAMLTVYRTIFSYAMEEYACNRKEVPCKQNVTERVFFLCAQESFTSVFLLLFFLPIFIGYYIYVSFEKKTNCTYWVQFTINSNNIINVFVRCNN